MMTEGNRVVCLGEALVDFAAGQPTPCLAESLSFVPRFGGSQANIAVGAARFGAHSAFVGGAGDDPWGRWLRDTLVAEGVDVSHFELLHGVETPHAFVALSEEGEPEFAFYGDREECVAAAWGRLTEVLGDGRGGVFAFGSDTLIGERERKVTNDARRLAYEADWQVLYDPNLRPGRWPNRAQMREEAMRVLADCTVVKANLEEARVLTGTDDPRDAARTLVGLGPEAVIVTMGAGGAVLAAGTGPPVHVPAPPARVVDTTGAGDSLAAVIAAALARGPEPRVLPAVVELAAATASRVVEAHGALTGLPPAGEARAALAHVLGGDA